jgi:hypothetical protein
MTGFASSETVMSIIGNKIGRVRLHSGIHSTTGRDELKSLEERARLKSHQAQIPNGSSYPEDHLASIWHQKAIRAYIVSTDLNDDIILPELGATWVPFRRTRTSYLGFPIRGRIHELFS